ncbi:prepronociceptin isoform X1 [Pogona vitticeps]
MKSGMFCWFAPFTTPLDTMRILMCCMFSFGLLAYALGDCRKDCLSCHRHLHGRQDDFSLLICVMECEGKLSSRATWGLCSKATSGRKASLPLGFESWEEEASPALELWDGNLRRGKKSLRRFGDLTRVVDLSKAEEGNQVSKARGLIRQPEAEEDTSHGSPDLLGDFLGGSPFGYGEQRADPGVQELQKRFGGFIGVRKSARKWHNQKRFSEFLKQYLGMSPRSVDYEGMVDDLKEQNEI